MREEYTIPSTSGEQDLHLAIWKPRGDIQAILQISHGMIEYIERYNEFAEYMSEQGILVIGNDHLGHGHSVSEDEDLGYFCKENMSQTVVDDLHQVTLYAKEKYGDVPYFLLGHSMGSFMARRYIMTYGEELDGAIIMGTGMTPGPVLAAGKLCNHIIGKMKGERHRSQFIQKLSFSGYNKRIKDPKSANAWLTTVDSVVEAYDKDKYCTFLFTTNGYRTLFDTLTYIQDKENVQKIPKDLPILFVAGKEDPVGNYGAGVVKVYRDYRRSGIKDVRIRLYEGARHEILNESMRAMVYRNLSKWIFHYIYR